MPRKLIGGALLIAFAGLIIHVCAALVRKDIRHMVPTLVRLALIPIIIGSLNPGVIWIRSPEVLPRTERPHPGRGSPRSSRRAADDVYRLIIEDVVGNEVLTSYTRGSKRALKEGRSKKFL